MKTPNLVSELLGRRRCTGLHGDASQTDWHSGARGHRSGHARLYPRHVCSCLSGRRSTVQISVRYTRASVGSGRARSRTAGFRRLRHRSRVVADDSGNTHAGGHPCRGIRRRGVPEAGLYGRKFGFILFNVDRSDYWPSRFSDWGLGDSFVGIRPSGVSFAEVQAAFVDSAMKQSVIERVLSTCEQMVRGLGADVVIPGEMPLNLLLSTCGVSHAADATILDGLGITLKTAEMAVDLRRQSGMSQSRRGYFHAAPNKERVQQVLKFYGLDRLGERIPVV